MQDPLKWKDKKKHWTISKPDLKTLIKTQLVQGLRFDHLCLYLSHGSWKKKQLEILSNEEGDNNLR